MNRKGRRAGLQKDYRGKHRARLSGSQHGYMTGLSDFVQQALSVMPEHREEIMAVYNELVRKAYPT